MENTLIQNKFIENNVVIRTLSAIAIFGLLIIVYSLGEFAINTFIMLLTGVMLFEVWSIRKNDKPSFFIKFIFSAYIISSIIFLLLLLDTKGSLFVFWMILTVSTNDTAAFFIGRFLKGKKLIPSVSPNKTWSGFIGGLVVGTTVSYYSQLFLMEKMFSIFWCFLISFSSHLGDLLESAFKRYLNIKDTSSLIPGHGGVIDRLDGILCVSFFIYIVMTLWF